MGAVWEAVHESTGQRYALKVVLGLDAETRTRFQREARTLAQLNHPHVVRLHTAELEGPEPFLIQELLAGGDLSQKIARGPLPAEEARAIAGQIAQGIAAAHAAGVQHRDLKPENVLFDEDGAAKVADFGLARSHGTAEGLTHTGALLGTPGYMAPEQAVDSRRVGPAADVYALGAVLYAMLTGVPPLRTRGRSLLAALTALQREPPTPPRELNPHAPADLEAVCLRALEKDPEQRYASAEAFLEALEPVDAGPPLGWVLLAASLCATAALTLALILVQGERAETPSQPRPDDVSATSSQPELPGAEAPDHDSDPQPDPEPEPVSRTRRLYSEAAILRAPGAHRGVAVAFRAGWLTACGGILELWESPSSPASWSLELPGDHASKIIPHALLPLDERTLLFAGLNTYAYCVQEEQGAKVARSRDTTGLARNGELIACGRANGKITVVRYFYGVPELLFASDTFASERERLHAIAWADASRLLLAIRGQYDPGKRGTGAHDLSARLVVCDYSEDTGGRRLEQVGTLLVPGVSCVESDGEGRVVLGSTMGAVLEWTVQATLHRRDLVPLVQLANVAGSCNSLAFVPGGRLLVASTGPTSRSRLLILVDLETRDARGASLGDFEPWDVCVDDTGRRAAVGSEDGRWRVYDLERLWADGEGLDALLGQGR